MEIRVAPVLARHDFRALARLQLEEATTRHTTKVEVPDSAVGHIIGKAHRTINALGHMPGVTHVSVHEDVENEEKQIVRVEGSEDAVEEVLAQIKRLHMRSCAASAIPEMHYACFVDGSTVTARQDDPLMLRVAGEDKLSLHMPQHLRSFLYRNFPEDFDDRTYYYFHSRSSGEAAAMLFIVQSCTPAEDGDAKPRKPSIRKKFLEKTRASLVLGSWEKAAYHHHLKGAVSKLVQNEPGGGRTVIKIRLVLGKTLYHGTSLCKGELWKISVGQMDDKVLYQTLRPSFSVFSPVESVCKARQFLLASGYRLVSFTRRISAKLVDMDSEPDSKESYQLELDRCRNEIGPDDEPAVSFCKVCKRHTFLTFLNDHKGVDLELRMQSRESEDPLDPQTKRSLFAAWHDNVSTVEHPLLSPSGRRYYPLNVLNNDAETYNKDGYEVVLTKVTAGKGDSSPLDEKSSSCRWKVSIRSLHLRNLSLSESPTESDISRQADDILDHVERLLSEASKLAKSMACG